MSGLINIRFYEELNVFLPPAQRKIHFEYRFDTTRSVKDLIESIGVPHTEIDLILVNGNSVGFDYCLKDGDHISVYPVFESLDISSVTKLRPKPLRVTRFVLDAHLGRLAAYLRMLGFDTLYQNNYDDPTLAGISHNDLRILLTRDKRLLMRKNILHGYYVRERLPQKQLHEIVIRFDLCTSIKPFTRCLICNGAIRKVNKNSVVNCLESCTKDHFDTFWQCKDCHKVYWKGSHYQRMQEIINQLDCNLKCETGKTQHKGDQNITSLFICHY